MKKQRLVVANWKMHPKTITNAKKLFVDIKKHLSRKGDTKVVIAAPSLYLGELRRFHSSKRFVLGAQNAHWENEGAHTGEVSPSMLKSMEVTYSIVGHSERRALGETDVDVNKKIHALLKAKVTPIVCLGEEKRDDSGMHLKVIKNQLSAVLDGVGVSTLSRVVLTYEPIWAISTHSRGVSMQPEDIHEMILYIQKLLVEKYTKAAAKKVTILYGGSVNAENAYDIMQTGVVDGFLVGSASLKATDFNTIIHATEE